MAIPRLFWRLPHPCALLFAMTIFFIYCTFICRTLQEKLPCSQIWGVVLTNYSPKWLLFRYNKENSNFTLPANLVGADASAARSYNTAFTGRRGAAPYSFLFC